MNKESATPEQKVTSLEEFVSSFEQIEGIEEKLDTLISYMSDTLSKPSAPYFKGFWEARKLCFPLFKEEIGAVKRAELWNRYRELTREGRELKNMLDQETAFAVEQIDLAIASLEKELEEGGQEHGSVSFPDKLKSLEGRESFYLERQQKLNGYNFLASRINSLRKELVKTEMRIRHKNKFFQRLSKLGDRVFPERKALIKEISEAFEGDVGSFIEAHFSKKNFSHERVRRSVFFFREEIKALQAVAKTLTLNTHAFTATRESLSECWDQLRGMEKELKKEYAEQKVKSAENSEEVRKRLQEFAQKREEMSVDAAYKELDTIGRSMREIELTRTDVAALKDEIKELRAPLEAVREQKEQELKEQQVAFEKARKEKAEEFKGRLKALVDYDLEELESKLEVYKKELSTLSIPKGERQVCERLLRSCRDKLAEKREAALLSMSDDARANLESLEKLLEERRDQRREIKEQIEEYRKVMGGSALDIEKAMKFNELMAQEKERLEKCDHAIEEVEQKIEELRRT
ncbi:MAG: hypothetical protein H7A36_02615 [Chlamydiales bacterium]|nr:hypothetical protein [Chlamydiales bacterium]